MKVYYYRCQDGMICGYDHELSVQERHDICDKMELIGTCDLPIEQVKKEVEKEIDALTLQADSGDCSKCVGAWIPGKAYDPKLVYKIKE